MKKNQSKTWRNASLLVLLILAAAGSHAQSGGPPPGVKGGGGGGMRGNIMGMFGPADLNATVPTDIKDFQAKDFMTLVRKTDIRSSFYDSDMTATITMVSVSPDRGTFTRKEIIYRRDKDDAFLMLT
ncbi:MAG: hypothetical protein WA234_05690, partial [Rectinemataceae bacterium]